ncbi:acetyltransferase [Flammeovirgaceae bacterium 311]|nr:acetyltransferase [Flammeovirgaceae bacterium 311]
MIISCHNCTLRPWQASDKEALLKHANNYKIWQNLRDRFPHPYTAADADWWLQHAGKQQAFSQFAIDVKGEAVGGIGLELQQDVERVSAELGYWLGESFWGQGIITVAIKELTGWAIPALSLSRIYALPFIHNGGSVRALEKAGYQREGILKRSAIKEGRIIDQVMYAFTDADLVLV